MPKMTFINPDGTRLEVEAPVGLSVLEIAHRNNISLEGACEGSLACSTCHVVIDPEWYDVLQSASEDVRCLCSLGARLGRWLALPPTAAYGNDASMSER